MKIIRTDSSNEDFRALVALLDQLLGDLDGEEHSFYAQFNKVDLIKHAVVAYIDEQPVGCGAIKAYNEENVELKRMFVHAAYRNRGIASALVNELEGWAGELGFSACILETGLRQPEAISLYHKLGYSDTENYGQYAGVENSVCMEKKLR